MSRFANVHATARLVLKGGCQCPGTPHDEDWIEMRTQLGTADSLAIAAGSSIDALEVLVVGWNLLDDDGPAPVDREHLGALFAEVFTEIDGFIEKYVSVTSLPKASAAPSDSGSRASASRRRGMKAAS